MFFRTNAKCRKARHLLAAAVVATTCVVTTGSAKAALMDVKEIVITSAQVGVISDSWIQVSEVIALDGSSTDQALAATAAVSATSTFGSGSSPAFAIDGIGPAAFSSIYHSGAPGLGQALTITFNTAFELVALSIFGRTDCCSYRDVYNVEIFNSSDQSIFTALNQSADNMAHEAVVVLDTVAPIPVPAALPLLAGGLGLMGLMGWRRKRKAKAA